MRQVPGSVIRTVLFATLAALVGCGSGSASVTDGITNTSFKINTVYGYITTVLTALDSKGNYQAATTKPLDVVGSGATFDATQDLRYASAATQLQDNDDNAHLGSFLVHITDMSKITVGTPYDFSAIGDLCTVNFGETQLTDSTTLPGPFIMGSKVTCTISFSQLGSAVGGTFTGTLTYIVAAAATDPADVETGTLTVKVSGPLVNEQLGACNLSLGVGAACGTNAI